MTYGGSKCHIHGMNKKFGQLLSASVLKLYSVAANVR